MASVTYNSNTYDGRKLTLTITQTADPFRNQSTLYWTLQSTGGNVNYYTIAETTVTIDGTQVYHCPLTPWDSKTFPAACGSASGSLIVKHDADGTKSVTTKFTTNVYSTTPKNYGYHHNLTPIDRTAPAITASVAARTTTTVTITASASRKCDIWGYKLNNDAWEYFSTSHTSKLQETISGLTPNTSYTIIVRGRGADNASLGNCTVTAKTLGASTLLAVPNIAADTDTVKLNFFASVANPQYTHNLTLAAASAPSTAILTFTGKKLADGLNSLTLTAAQRAALLKAINAKTLNAVLTLATKDGNAAVGDPSTASVTVQTTAENSAPAFQGFWIEDTNPKTSALTGASYKIIQNQSSVKIEIIEADAKNGAAITQYTATADGKTRTINAGGANPSIAFGAIAKSGDVPITVTAIDSRGYSTSVTKTENVIPYEPVKITGLTLRRANETEERTQVELKGTISPLTVNGTNKNSLTALTYRKRKMSELWSAETTIPLSSVQISGNTATFTDNEWITIPEDDTAMIGFTLKDQLTEAYESEIVTKSTPLVSFRPQKVGINKRDPESALDVSGEIRANGAIVLGYAGDASGNLNTYTKGGIWRIQIPSNLTNVPSSSSGMLEVLSNGNSYVVQRYTEISANVKVYVRAYGNGTWSAWREM